MHQGLAEPYLRRFVDLNDTDIHSYQALIDVFAAENLLPPSVTARSMILDRAALTPPK